MIYYKVVKQTKDGKLISVNAYTINPNFGVEYKLNEFVFANKGEFLCVFSSFDDAKNFYKQFSSAYIYKCECTGINDDSINPIINYITDKVDWPKGTVHAHGVKLLEVLYPTHIKNDTRFLISKNGENVGYFHYIDYKWYGINLSNNKFVFYRESDNIIPLSYIDKYSDLDETMLKYGLNYKILPSYTSLDIKIKTDVDYNQ